MWALITNGTVTEITDIDPTGRFHPSIPWHACSVETEIGWLFDGEAFSPPFPGPLEELAARKCAEIEAALGAALAAGMPYTMPDGSDDVIQTRPDEDEANLLGLAIEARDLRTAGETEAVMELRAKSNTVYMLTPEQMIDLTDAAKAFKQGLLAKSWQLKDAVSAAEAAGDREAIEAVAWEE